LLNFKITLKIFGFKLNSTNKTVGFEPTTLGFGDPRKGTRAIVAWREGCWFGTVLKVLGLPGGFSSIFGECSVGLEKDCRARLQEYNKTGLAIFGFFYNFL
jgi:hypothetical protein